MKKRYRISVQHLYAVLLTWLIAVLLGGCNLMHKTNSKTNGTLEVKKNTDSSTVKQDSGRVIKENVSKTSDFDYERMTQLLARDPVTNHIYPTAIIRETGNLNTTEQTNKSDSSFNELFKMYLLSQMAGKEQTNTESNNKFSHGFLNMGQLIGIGVVLLIIGYFLSRIKIGFK